MATLAWVPALPLGLADDTACPARRRNEPDLDPPGVADMVVRRLELRIMTTQGQAG